LSYEEGIDIAQSAFFNLTSLIVSSRESFWRYSLMKEHISPTITAYLRRAFSLLTLLAVCAILFASGQRQARAQACAGIGWTAGPDMPSTGVRMVGVYFGAPNGKFYVVGGRSMDGVGNDFTHPFEYDPNSNTWTIKSAIFPDSQVSNMACGVLNDSGTPYICCVGGSAGLADGDYRSRLPL
jgi:hypothetical protein